MSATISRQANQFLQACLLAPIRVFQGRNPLKLPRPTPRKKVALLIGVTYAGNKHFHLVAPPNDVQSVKGLLQDKFGYAESSITVLVDTLGASPESRPTRENIMTAIDNFIVESDADYVFLYSGHSYQREETKEPRTEEDELEEFIIPCDALQSTDAHDSPPPFEDFIDQEKVISDWELHDKLVNKIKNLKNSQLVALFDSCHSGTLLNLKHHRCNRVGDIKSYLRRASRRFMIEPIQNHFGPIVRTETQRSIPAFPAQTEVGGCWPTPPAKTKKQCSGFCPRLPIFGKPPVICISACKDSQITLERNNGGSTTLAIVKLLSDVRRPTYEDVMRAARAGVSETRGLSRAQARAKYKEYKIQKIQERHLPKALAFLVYDKESREKRRELRQQMGFHASSDPQLSSLRPLTMRAKLSL